MGTREEGIKAVLVRGYSGKIRPHQAEAGACVECGGVVYVDACNTGAGKTITDRVTYVHLGCEAVPPSEHPLSNIIPVGGGNS